MLDEQAFLVWLQLDSHRFIGPTVKGPTPRTTLGLLIAQRILVWSTLPLGTPDNLMAYGNIRQADDPVREGWAVGLCATAFVPESPIPETLSLMRTSA